MEDGRDAGGGERAVMFGEGAYFAFLVVAASAFHAMPRRLRPWWLFACGLAVYAYYSPAFVWLLLVEIAVVFALGKACCKRSWGGTVAFGAALAITLGVHGAYKYAGLLERTAHAALPGTGLPSFPQLYLPLAISFFTLEFVHYLVESRRGALPTHRLSDFLAFAVFFPTMVAGPIKRFPDFQLGLSSARLSAEDVAEGARRIVFGVAKATIVAGTAAPWTMPLLSDSAMRTATRGELVTALVAFSVWIYAGFSGYSDIAIGSARLFGIRVPENFAWPYLRTSIASFWRHWHISLTSWIADYVYYPLGGSRRSLPRTFANLLAAAAATGLWYGAAWHYAAWGAYHGVLLAGHRAWRAFVAEPLARRAPEPAPAQPASALGIVSPVTAVAWRGSAVLGRLAAWALTLALITLGWGLFAMPLPRFVEMLGRLL